ncbi:MAG: molybdenum cofactor guanylyltransferase MobA [Campylobacterota bacterium]|nr:molybdenum cofactor guanylyltransferase MobA [Campylobacterota bacterium]
MLSIPCVIFAGGKSSRMGEDKALLPFGEYKTLTEFQYSRLSKIFSHVYISCKNKNKFDFDANFIEDVNHTEVYAPTLGFASSFKKLEQESFFVISVDSPFIDLKTIKKIVSNDNSTFDATIARTPNGIEPLCGIYHSSLESSFNDMLKTSNHKLGFLLGESNTQYIDFTNDAPFANLNHPHEYKKALSLINS